jgi:hypothetical protein
MTTTILFLSKDVFFWPVVKQAAARCNAELRIIRRWDDPELREVPTGEIACCMIDLAALDAADIAQAVKYLREQIGSRAKLVAFGPHVQESRLTAAEEAGCSPVLSRGQFQAKLSDLLPRWLE